NKLKNPAVDSIRAGFHYHIYRGTAAPEFRAHGVLFGAEFLNCVRRRKYDNSAKSELIIVNTVQKEVVVRDSEAVDRQGFVCPFVFKNAAGSVRSSLATVSPWPEIGKLNEISPV